MTRHCRLHSLLQLPALGTSRNGQGTHNGDVCSVTRIAGIMAAKCTPDLILLCHPGIDITGRTGMQMEAMTATMGAALTVYDMLKAVDMGMMIEGARLIEKQGGKSNRWVREKEEDNKACHQLE